MGPLSGKESSGPSFLRRLRTAPGVLRRALAAELRRRRGDTDRVRWGAEANLSDAWRPRTAMLAAHVPRDSVVLELGCGAARTEELLPAGCRHVPSDLVARGPDTFVCDLNARALPAFPEHDVVLASGTLEYVVDVGRLLRHLAGTRLLLFSYACHSAHASLLVRRNLGWLSDLTHEDVIALAREGGWAWELLGQWQGQSLYAFRRPGR